MSELDERFDRAADDRLADSVDVELRERPADQLLGLEAVVDDRAIRPGRLGEQGNRCCGGAEQLQLDAGALRQRNGQGERLA